MIFALCDDCKLELEMLTVILKHYCKARKIHYDIREYDSGKQLVEDVTGGKVAPDIIMLDIMMPGLSGMDAARGIRKSGYVGDIMFVTAYPDYALDGYEVDARGYILKPFDSDKIAATFNRVFQNHPPRFYTLRTQSKIVTIPLYDIMYIESCNTMCTIHCNCNITYREYKKLSDIEQELNDNRFLRCHQSYLVNMDYIKSAGAEFLLDDGEVVAIRQKGIGEVKKRFYQYIRG